jgi:hypothetical protein
MGGTLSGGTDNFRRLGTGRRGVVHNDRVTGSRGIDEVL